MATADSITLRLSVHRTKLAMRVAWTLFPLVWLGIMSEKRASDIAWRFVKVKVTEE